MGPTPPRPLRGRGGVWDPVLADLVAGRLEDRVRRKQRGHELPLRDGRGAQRGRLPNITRVPNGPNGVLKPDWQPARINSYPRPKGATPFQTFFTVAYDRCTSPNETHGAPLAVGSCSPPVPTSDYLTIGTLDSNGQKANSYGWVRADVHPGNSATLADEADVKLFVFLRDVRNKDLSDYTGEIAVSSTRRITDKDSTGAPDGGTSAATTAETPLSVTVPCASTDDTEIGSLCTITTSADTIVPGQVKEGARSIWQLGQVKIYDGGSDSDADTTADNTLFMDEGIFIP
jgi:hypothetical protein